MNRYLAATLLIASSWLAAAAADAKTIYVNGSTGDDSVTYANNSVDRPWRSLGRALWGSASRSSPAASEAARAGDVVIVAAGVYDTAASTGERNVPIYNPVNNGAAGSPIVIRAESPGAVSLRSTQSNATQPIIGTFGKSYITWDGFLIDEQYVPTHQDTGPVVVWDSNNVTIQNSTVRGYNRGWVDNHNAIRIEAADNIVIRNNLLTGYRESQQGMNASAITLYHTLRALIENNEIVDANTGIFVKGVISGPITIRKNLIRSTTTGIYFGGVGTSTASNGATAYNNVIYDATFTGIGFISYDSYSPANVIVANNTVVLTAQSSNSDGGAILFRGGTGNRNIRIHNNVFGRSRNGITSWEAAVVAQFQSSHNAFYQAATAAYIAYSGHTLDSWRSQFNRDTVGSTVATNPGFQNEAALDFRLASSSPLLGAGVDVLDLNSNGSTSDRVNIGAYALGNEIIGRTSGVEEPVQPRPPGDVRVD
jgi:hypothetical protein